MADKQPYNYAHMKRTLDGLMKAWSQQPYLRLGQLLSNANQSKDEPVTDLFYIEDDVLTKQTMEWVEKCSTL